MGGAQGDAGLGFGDDGFFGRGRDASFGFDVRVAHDFGGQLVALAVVPEFRAVLVADVVDLRLLVGGRRLRRVMRAEDDALFQPLPGEQAGHGFPDVGQGLRLVLQRAAPKDAQGHGHHAVPVRELDAGRPRRRIHPGHSAETQGCAPVAFQRRDPPFLLRVVESAHVALNSPASGAVPRRSCICLRFCGLPW